MCCCVVAPHHHDDLDRGTGVLINYHVVFRTLPLEDTSDRAELSLASRSLAQINNVRLVLAHLGLALLYLVYLGYLILAYLNQNLALRK